MDSPGGSGTGSQSTGAEANLIERQISQTNTVPVSRATTVL